MFLCFIRGEASIKRDLMKEIVGSLSKTFGFEAWKKNFRGYLGLPSVSIDIPWMVFKTRRQYIDWRSHLSTLSFFPLKLSNFSIVNSIRVDMNELGSIEQLEQLLGEFYHHSTSNFRRSEIDRLLKSFQESDSSYKFLIENLASGFNNQYLWFFSVSTIEVSLPHSILISILSAIFFLSSSRSQKSGTNSMRIRGMSSANIFGTSTDLFR
jgi:hypothetical protein